MKLLLFILKPEFYLPIIYILVGCVCFVIIKKIITALFSKRKNYNVKNRKRYNTLLQVTIDCVKIVIVSLVLLSILTVYGVDVKAALAGIGIISVLIGLAFQDLFKDFIVGFAIILEDYFSVGDTIEVDDFKGEVIHIGIKSTKIKRYDGPILIISNRNIDKVINYSTANSLAMVEIPVAYESDIDHIEDLLQKLFKKLSEKITDITGDIDIWGVEELGSSAVVIKVVAKTVPLKNFAVERKIRKEVKKIFDKENIKIPYNQIEVHNGK